MKVVINYILKYKYVFLIFLLALALRLFKLQILPYNFQEDEILVGYVGRYILENGVDLYGNPWPLLYFNKFGDYYIIGPMYLSAISTFIFGVNEFAVRFPAAFFGSLVVFPTYIFTNWTVKNKTVGLIAALFVSILPWHIILSRSSVEGIIGSTIFLTALISVIYAIKKNEFKYVIISSVLLFITYWIYHPFRMYAPLVYIPLLILFPTMRKQKKIFLSIIVSIIFFFALTGYISTTGWGKGRLMQTSIFSPLSGVERKINEQIFASGEGHVLETRIFNNKVIGYSREFIRQYLSYFSPGFLFFNSVESRYDMPDQGLFYFTFLVLLLASLFPIGKKLQPDQKLLYYVFFLIILAPLPSATTYLGSPNLHRSVLLGILLVIPAAVGLYKLSSIKFGKLLVVGVSVILFVEMAYFWHQYSVQADVYNAIRRNDAFKELAIHLRDNKNKYDHIYVPSEGNTALYYLFFTKNFDSTFSSQFKSDAIIDKVENIHFIDASCPEVENISEQDRVLVVLRHQCPPAIGLKEVGEIKGKNFLLGFKLYSN